MEVQEDFPDCLAVQKTVDRLGRGGGEGVIGSRLPDLGDAWRVAFIFAGIRVEMTDPQRFTSHQRKRQWVFEQTAKDTSAALGGLIEQDVAWLLPIW